MRANKVDLDEVQKRLDKVKNIGDDHTTWWVIGTHDAPALASELRAARKVVEAARKVRGVFAEDGPLARSIEAYDHTGQAGSGS